MGTPWAPMDTTCPSAHFCLIPGMILTISAAIVFYNRSVLLLIVKFEILITHWISSYDTGPKITLNCPTSWGLACGLTSCLSVGRSGPVVCRRVFRLVPACILLCCCATTRVCTKQNTPIITLEGAYEACWAFLYAPRGWLQRRTAVAVLLQHCTLLLYVCQSFVRGEIMSNRAHPRPLLVSSRRYSSSNGSSGSSDGTLLALQWSQ